MDAVFEYVLGKRIIVMRDDYRLLSNMLKIYRGDLGTYKIKISNFIKIHKKIVELKKDYLLLNIGNNRPVFFI